MSCAAFLLLGFVLGVLASHFFVWLPPREESALEVLLDRGARGAKCEVQVWPLRHLADRLTRRSGLLWTLLVLRLRGQIRGSLRGGMWRVEISPRGRARLREQS